MDKDYYEEHIIKDGHLSNPIYKVVPENSDKKVFNNLIKLIEKYKSNLTKKEIDYITNYKWTTSQFKCLPKIHKCKSIQEKYENCSSDIINILRPKDLKGRPIVAGPESPTQRLSSLIEKILTPIVSKLTTYIKDDWDFIRKLPKNIEYDATLYSCDIESLYTSIPIELGLKAIEYWIDEESNLISIRFSKEFILVSLEFILRNNNFKFDNLIYNQTEGTAMGTSALPPMLV